MSWGGVRPAQGISWLLPPARWPFRSGLGDAAPEPRLLPRSGVAATRDRGSVATTDLPAGDHPSHTGQRRGIGDLRRQALGEPLLRGLPVQVRALLRGHAEAP